MPVDFQDSCYWVLLVWGCFSVSKTIIPDPPEHFLTSSARRDTHLFGGLGLRATNLSLTPQRSTRSSRVSRDIRADCRIHDIRLSPSGGSRLLVGEKHADNRIQVFGRGIDGRRWFTATLHNCFLGLGGFLLQLIMGTSEKHGVQSPPCSPQMSVRRFRDG